MIVFTKDNIGSICFQEYEKKVPTKACRIKGAFRVVTREGSLTCKDGYLAVDSAGWPYPIAANEFASVYKLPENERESNNSTIEITETTMEQLAKADWKALERDVVTRIRIMAILARTIKRETPDEIETADKIANNLILPNIQLLASFCAAIKQTDEG